MRVSVRAGEVREGDRLIVPVVNGGEREIAVGPDYPVQYSGDARCLAWGSAGPIVRHFSEWVVVERPDPPITITVELSAEEADAYVDVWGEHAVRTTATSKFVAAIVAARAGETQ